jgi:two-component system sensor histidine kinase KdpD
MSIEGLRFSSSMSRVWQFVSAFVFLLLITGGLFILRDVLDTTLVALIYLLPLGVISARWGLTAGVASAILTFFTFNYFFIQPYYSLAVHRPIDVVILVIFLIVAIVISQLMGSTQAGLATATARERESTQLYELSISLTGLQNDHAIAQTLAGKIISITDGEFVELKISGTNPFTCYLPENKQMDRSPDFVVRIEAARGTLGEIRLWRASPDITPNEERLLRTFASQGALALERAWLAQAEARAQVLEESDQLKSAILSSVSHELRTPLSTIKAAASSLRSGEVGWDSPARMDLITAIDDEADHLNLLVGNLLDMSRIESGALKPKREWNILPEIIGSVLTRMKNLTTEHRIEIHLPENLPLIPVDYVQMEQVFTNLISNSLKYTPVNTVVSITAHVQDDTVHIQVSNQGPQVPPEDLERIFDKFYRITDAERVSGTGLGLSICKGIIEAHGGHIWVENISDGLVFHFTLPLTLDGTAPPELPMDMETE